MKHTENKFFESIIKTYTAPLLNQFRKDFLTTMQQRKQRALRSRVKQASKSNKTPTSTDSKYFKLTMTNITNDSSPKKQTSHAALQDHIATKKSIPPAFTKPFLLKMCQAYNIGNVTKDNKANLQKKLLATIPKCD